MLSRSIFLGKKMVEQGEKDCKKIKEAMTAEIEKEPLAKIDYVKIVDLSTMQQVETTEHGVLAAIAVYIGKTIQMYADGIFKLKGKNSSCHRDTGGIGLRRKHHGRH